MAAPADSLIYDTVALIGVVPNLKRPTKFLADKFFPVTVMSETEKVAIDVEIGKRRIAPFVSPLVQGKLVEQLRMQTNEFKPPYIKDKRAPDLRKPVRRMLGERIGGSMTGAERQMANLAAEMTDQVDMIDRRIEWMAASALRTGTVTVAGEGFPTQLVDFGRDPSLTIALTGAGQWGVPANFDAEGRDPVPPACIETWQHQILKKSGAVTTDLVFTTTPWNAFKNSQGVFGAIYFPKQADGGNVILNGPQIGRGGIYKGRWGNYDLWLYNEWWVDENDVEQPMLPDGTVVLAGPDMMGTKAFGMIIDPEFSYASMAYAPKTWMEKDPAQQMLMMQSAPIVIPTRVNASLGATVCAGQVT